MTKESGGGRERSISFFTLWAWRNYFYCCWLLYNFFPVPSHKKQSPMGKPNPSYIRVVKAFPSHVGDSAGKGMKRPVKSEGH